MDLPRNLVRNRISRTATLRITVLAMTSFFACVVATARADTITIGASKDATIYGGFVNNSNGAGPGVFAGTDGTPNRLRSLVAFDVAANVPSGAAITSVQLTLTLGMVAGSGGGMPGPNPVT